MEYNAVVAFVTIPAAEAEAARRITDALLGQRKAACVNILPAVESHYWWQGKIEAANEILLIIKTRANLLPDLITLVKSLHPFTLPEIIALPIIGGNDDYLRWVEVETS